MKILTVLSISVLVLFAFFSFAQAQIATELSLVGEYHPLPPAEYYASLLGVNPTNIVVDTDELGTIRIYVKKHLVVDLTNLDRMMLNDGYLRSSP